jgi:TonB-dependent SusC/RagA subfamily outer membrane receptor
MAAVKGKSFVNPLPEAMMSILGLTRVIVAITGFAIIGSGCSRNGAPVSQPSPADERTNRTTSVGTLNAEDIDRVRHGRIEEVLEGQVAGLQVLRLPNGEYSLRIRGVNTLRGNAEPLIVLDGMPISQRNTRMALAGINPRDVASVHVLKDAGSTSIYGMRGANGVIVINTKRNNRNR